MNMKICEKCKIGKSGFGNCWRLGSTTHKYKGGLDDRGWIPGRNRDSFFSPTRLDRLLSPTQPPIQWVTGALSPGVKRPALQADHSPQSGTEVKNMWS